jgi:hypothetical protein
MDVYITKVKEFAGGDYSTVERQARKVHNNIAAKSKRQPYVRSKYFEGDKIFILTFWAHLNQKPRSDRKRRLKYYECAIELLVKSNVSPTIKSNPNKNGNTVYRFYGVDPNGKMFIVQINEDRRTGNKHFISTFPYY